MRSLCVGKTESKEVDRVTDPKCVFCRQKSLVILHEAENTVCVQVEAEKHLVPGAFLVITKTHVAPDEPTAFNFRNEAIQHRQWLVASNHASSIDNWTGNLTEDGGLQIAHLHEWQLDRRRIELDLFLRLGGKPPKKGFYAQLIEAATSPRNRW